jgi:hypothetical protein
MKLELTIPTLAIRDTIISGIEGGIQYWARAVSYELPPRGFESESDLGIACDLIELDTGERFSLQEQWMAAVRLMAEKYPRKFAEIVNETGDCTTGDVLIQLAVFGEVRYG